MKLQLNRYLIFALFIITAYLVSPSTAYAFIPEVNVRVINAQTNAPVPGVWVKQKNTGMGTNPGWSSFMTNNCSGENSNEPIDGRFSMTDVNGSAKFLDPETIPTSSCDIPIDSNKDGTNDTVRFPCTTGERRDINGNPTPGTTCIAYGEFSCYGSPMSFEVVRPSGDLGTYTAVSGVSMPNAAADMEITIYYSPPGTTAPPQPTPNLTVDTTKKDIGTLSSIADKFQPLKILEEGKDYWVRIQIYSLGRAFSHIWLYEKINSEYFDLYKPSFNSPETATFFIQSYVAHGSSFEMKERMSIDCPDAGSSSLPSCITYTDGASSFLAKPFEAMSPVAKPVKYVFFKVRAKKSSGGLPIKVNVNDTYPPVHTDSYVNFIETIPHLPTDEVGLDNEDVVICPVGGCTAASVGYFQVRQGDTFSRAIGAQSIKSDLPTGTNFSPDTNSVILYKGAGAYFGNGGTNARNWSVNNYEVTDTMSYNELFASYGDKVTTKNIHGISDFTTSGTYIDTSSQANNSKKYTITGAGWETQLTGKQVIFFIPGDLYINTNTDIGSSGDSSLIYIVAGNIGIAPSVTRVEGIFFADGAIDTACDSAIGFSGTSCSSGSLSVATALNSEGIYYARSGFQLGRQVPSGTSEIFTGRPDFIFSSMGIFGKKIYSWTESIQ